MNGKNGHQPPSLPDGEWLSVVDRIRLMREQGWEHTLDSGRIVRLRTLEPHMLLADDMCPDILTPYLVKSLYEVGSHSPTAADFEVDLEDRKRAIEYAAMLDYIAAKSLADDTDAAELTLAEKKLIMKFALAGAELLVNFRYPAKVDVDAVEEVNDVAQATE